VKRSGISSRSRSLLIRLAAPVQLERPSTAALFPRLLTRIPSRSHCPSVAAQPAPPNKLLRREPVPARNRAHRFSVLVALSNDRPFCSAVQVPVGAPSAGVSKYFQSANPFRLILRGHSVLSREPMFSPCDQASVLSSLRTSAWRTLRRQARAMHRNGLHIARLPRGIRVCSRRAMGRQPRRASQG
jgi:hypothetical protein